MKKIPLLILIILFLGRNIGFAQISDSPVSYYNPKKLRFEDAIYEPSIRSIQFYQGTGDVNEMFTPPVLSILASQDTALILEFDELGDKSYNYYYKVINCNADWNQSQLNSMEYLNEFNEYIITNYAMAINTRVHYTHYRCSLPKIKIPGNYLVVIYRNGRPDDIVLSRRFIVYDNNITIQPALKIAQGIRQRISGQQIDFNISYSNYDKINNPMLEVNVVIRQNNRWDNALYGLKPLYIRDNEQILDYNFFNGENCFPGGNEFRSFDCRRVRTAAQNVRTVQDKHNIFDVYLIADEDRSKQGYTEIIDRNGKFIPGNTEMGQQSGDPDYVQVHFELKGNASDSSKGVFVFGALSDWQINNNFRMTYNDSTHTFLGNALLKQGYYNYLYAVQPVKNAKPDELLMEGSFYNTSNTYEIIVYHRPMGARSDLIIGYYTLNFNGMQ